MTKKVKKLYRSYDNRVLAGICGGLGEYLDIDAVIIRVLWVLAGFFSAGFAVFLYIALIFIIPLEEQGSDGKSIKV